MLFNYQSLYCYILYYMYHKERMMFGSRTLLCMKYFEFNLNQCLGLGEFGVRGQDQVKIDDVLLIFIG